MNTTDSGLLSNVERQQQQDVGDLNEPWFRQLWRPFSLPTGPGRAIEPLATEFKFGFFPSLWRLISVDAITILTVTASMFAFATFVMPHYSIPIKLCLALPLVALWFFWKSMDFFQRAKELLAAYLLADWVWRHSDTIRRSSQAYHDDLQCVCVP
jgi:hypothetical protein